MRKMIATGVCMAGVSVRLDGLFPETGKEIVSSEDVRINGVWFNQWKVEVEEAEGEK